MSPSAPLQVALSGHGGVGDHESKSDLARSRLARSKPVSVNYLTTNWMAVGANHGPQYSYSISRIQETIPQALIHVPESSPTLQYCGCWRYALPIAIAHKPGQTPYGVPFSADPTYSLKYLLFYLQKIAAGR